MRAGPGIRGRHLTHVGSVAWTATGGTLTLSGISTNSGTQAASLNAIFAAAGGAWATLTAVQVNSDLGWRLYGRDNDFQLASRLNVTSFRHIPSSGGVFVHEDGEPLATIHAELAENKAYLEGICPGLTVRSHLYPLHDHDRATMRALRELGYYAARDGWVSPTFPDGGLLGATDYTTVKEIQTWDLWQRFAMLGHLQFHGDTGGPIVGQSSAQIYNYLYATAANQSTPASTLYGYSSLMEAWKANNTWVSFNIHYDMTSADLNTLVSMFQNDGDFWIGTLAEIGEWAAARHAPYGSVRNDEFVYEPLSGHTAADYGGKPWNGKTCAITFTNDDGQTETATVYAAVMAARGVKFTAGIVKDAVGDTGYLTAGAIRALHDGGLVEIACHGKGWSPHPSYVDERGLKICCTNANSIMGIGITATGSHKTLQLYYGTAVTSSAAAAPWYAAVTSLAGFQTLHEASSLAFGHLGSGGAWPATVGTLTGSGVTVSTGQLIVTSGGATAGATFKVVQAISDEATANAYGTVIFPDTELSSASGFTVFALAKANNSSTTRVLLAKMNNAARAWGITSNLAGLSTSGGSAWDGTANTGFTDTASYHAFILTQIHGQPFRTYRDAVNSAYATANSASTAIYDNTVQIRLFTRDTGGNAMNAQVAAWGTLNIGYAHGAAELTTIMDALKTYGGLA